MTTKEIEECVEATRVGLDAVTEPLALSLTVCRASIGVSAEARAEWRKLLPKLAEAKRAIRKLTEEIER